MGLLNIGMSGLNAAQGSLATLSNNIANAKTPGYSRQQTMQTANGMSGVGGVFVGTGTTLSDVRRVYNQFLDTQLQTTTSLNFDAKAYLDQIGSVDKLLSDKSTGVGAALNSFFAALQTSSANPSDNSARQLVLTIAQTLGNRFNSIATELNKQKEGINSQLETVTGQVNQLTSSIAALNQQISQAKGQGNGEPANLLDARNEAVRSLNELVGVKVTESDGHFNVSLGTGQTLVADGISNKLSAVPSKDDKSQYSVVLTTGGQPMDVSSVISGGTIGGLLRYRQDVLMPAINDLGRTAMVVGESINTQLGQGLDANGQFGSSLFNDINSAFAIGQRSVGGSSNSANSGNLNVTITDTSKLSTFDYKVTFSDDKMYTVLRSDGKAMGTFDITQAPPQIDGFTLALDGKGPVAAGDTFKVSPTAGGAMDLKVVMTDPNKLAFSAPLLAEGNKNNSGTGVFDPPTLTLPLDIHGGADTAQLEAAIKNAMPVKMTFGKPAADGTQSYVINNAQGQPIGTGTIVPGQDNKLTINVPYVDAAGNAKTFGVNTVIRGEPKPDDSYTVSFNSSGKLDNRNALQLLDLQTRKTVGATDGNAGVSMSTAYSQLVSSVGGKASQANVDNSATSAMLAAATSNRSSVSQVNLDEEAGDMIRFQQYYTASSQIIKAAQETFSTLINSL
ncbi:flagellar hook-associated protein FlgK [Pseudomonas fluorescens]|uniref:Flagellar hook-associated protein 1 n=2 Tax=Pseudomonas fluorescens group TaxID=136843 RepID=A0ABS9F103_9PSED|nr:MULTISPECIES: flagellar hook-associated protein FlgK [Pseudomonas fluorescens group]AIG05436.1 flagellar hook protein FlgK [Pseudomonas fluorescens]MCF4980268.1 flagellar hook-associated protein FlgK [Pseudomonas gessardii]MCF4990191.1 flagellar hook-associated protein FlgK [Pseudomonas gessardii]MCF5085938.1 flagellar hook-associated protein FlgK [Pseudomonas gessardii]MCF5094071.1 flagellar hook-associated protein FlgK [Pseudomonas gessardii]